MNEYTLEDASELLDYLNEHPPVQEILVAVHGIKTNKRNRGASEKDFREGLNEASSMIRDPNLFGQSTVTPDIREAINWAEAEFAKMRKGKGN